MAWAQGILNDLERRWPATWRQVPVVRGNGYAFPRTLEQMPSGSIPIPELPLRLRVRDRR